MTVSLIWHLRGWEAYWVSLEILGQRLLLLSGLGWRRCYSSKWKKVMTFRVCCLRSLKRTASWSAMSNEPLISFERRVRVRNNKTNPKALSELLSPSGSEPQDVREMAAFLPVCKGKSGERVGLYSAAPRTATSWYPTSAMVYLGYRGRFGRTRLKK